MTAVVYKITLAKAETHLGSPRFINFECRYREAAERKIAIPSLFDALDAGEAA